MAGPLIESYDLCIAVIDSRQRTTDSDSVDAALFEFGMLTGRLGPRRVIPVVVVGGGGDVVRDWEGTAAQSLRADLTPDEAVRAAEADIIGDLSQATEVAGLPMLPSTALAIGYFNNFLSPVFDVLSTATTIQVQTRNRQREVLTEKRLAVDPGRLIIDIRVPRDLHSLEQSALAMYTKKERLDQIVVPTGLRDFPFFVRIESGPESKSGGYQLVDFPRTLIAASDALDVDALISRDFLARDGGRTRRRLEDREIANFESTLWRLAPARAETYFQFTVIESE